MILCKQKIICFYDPDQLKKGYVLNYFFLNYSISGGVVMKHMQEFFAINTSQNFSATL